MGKMKRRKSGSNLRNPLCTAGKFKSKKKKAGPGGSRSRMTMFGVSMCSSADTRHPLCPQKSYVRFNNYFTCTKMSVTTVMVTTVVK